MENQYFMCLLAVQVCLFLCGNIKLLIFLFTELLDSKIITTKWEMQGSDKYGLYNNKSNVATQSKIKFFSYVIEGNFHPSQNHFPNVLSFTICCNRKRDIENISGEIIHSDIFWIGKVMKTHYYTGWKQYSAINTLYDTL